MMPGDAWRFRSLRELDPNATARLKSNGRSTPAARGSAMWKFSWRGPTDSYWLASDCQLTGAKRPQAVIVTARNRPFNRGKADSRPAEEGGRRGGGTSNAAGP